MRSVGSAAAKCLLLSLLPLVFLLTASFPVRILSQGLGTACFNQTSGLYNITICPLASTAPPALTNRTVLTFANVDDGTSPRQYMPWGFHLFGDIFDQFYVSTNGNLQFGPAASTMYTTSIPVDLSNADVTPYIAPFWTDLYLNTTLGSISVSYEGTSPNRYAVIRWDHVTHYSTHSSTTLYANGITVDVVLYEGNAGLFYMKYYNIDDNPSGFATYSIGAESTDDGQSYAVLTLNNTRVTGFQASGNGIPTLRLLSGYSTRWTFTGKDISQYTCSGAGFDFTPYTNLTDLSWTSSTGTTYFYHPCGVVTNSVCATSITAERSMACAVTGTNPIQLAVYQPQQALYNPLSNNERSADRLSKWILLQHLGRGGYFVFQLSV